MKGLPRLSPSPFFLPLRFFGKASLSANYEQVRAEGSFNVFGTVTAEFDHSSSSLWRLQGGTMGGSKEKAPRMPER